MAGLESLGKTLNSTLSFGASDKARDANDAAAAQFDGMTPPELEQLKLQQMVLQGVITPEDAQTYLAQQSQLGGISLDPKLQKAQDDALASLQDIAQNKGITDMDRAQLAQIANEENVTAKGAREAILQNAQARGAGGSGMEILAQLQNAQDSATRKSQRDTQVAGTAQQRALQALQSAGQMGGQMQDASFGRQAQVAAANDAINKFNVQNQQQVALANTGAKNQAQSANLAASQNVANNNTQIANQQQQYNQNLGQQNFDNQYKIAAGKSGALANQAKTYSDEATGNKQLIGTLVGAGATAGAKSDENAKTDFHDFDASDFLDSITPSKYRYKNPERDGHGVHASPMAQDLEKTDVGRAMVEDTPHGKMVNYGHGFGTILASLSDVHERVKKMEGKKA